MDELLGETSSPEPVESASTSVFEQGSQDAQTETTTPSETGSVDSPLLREDAWADFGKVEEVKEEPAVEEVKEAKEEAKTEDNPAEEAEQSEEDAILEEIFSDTELDTLDPDKVIEAQGSRRLKAAARRNFEMAEVTKAYTDPAKPITEVLSKFEELNPQRFAELSETAAHRLVDTNPEATFQRAFVISMRKSNPTYDWKAEPLPTLNDFIAFKNGEYQPAPTETKTETAAKPTPEQITQAAAALDKAMGFDWRDPANDDQMIESELAAMQLLRAYEAENKGKAEQADKMSELEAKVARMENGVQTAEQQNLEKEMLVTANEFRKSIEEKLRPLIAKNTGLEVTENDTPEMKAFKERKMELFTGTPAEKARGQASTFEMFMYYDSSVKTQVNAVTDRLTLAQANETQSRLKGDTEAAKRYKAEADAERIPLMEMTAEAVKEFKEIVLKPDFKLIESLGSSITNHIKKAADRIEVTSSGAQTRPAPSSLNADSADDVWSNMVTDAQKTQQLRAA